MHITEKEYPQLFAKMRDDLSISERMNGFHVDDKLYQRFRYEADETMSNLLPSLCDCRTQEEIRHATTEEMELSRKVDGGAILIDGRECFLRDIDKETWAIYNAHMHPGFSKDTHIPELSETKSSPHSTAGLPKILDAAQHLISSMERSAGILGEAVKSEKSIKGELKSDLSHKMVAKLDITVKHEIPVMDALIELLKPRASLSKKLFLAALWAIAIALFLLLSGIKLHAQTVFIRGVPNGTTPATSATVTNACIANHSCLDVDLLNIPHIICDSGCGGAASFSDNSAFTVGTTAINVMGGYYTSGAAPTLSSGNAGRVRMDSNSYLFVDCVTGCAGGATTPADAFTTPTTAGLSASFSMGYNGSTWDLLRSGDKNNVTGITGVLNTGPMGRYNATQPTLTDTRYNLLQLSQRGELFVSPGVSGFPVTLTSTTITGTVGVTQSTSPWVISFTAPQHTIVDSGTLTAVTAITNALPAGSNVIGHVIADSGSTTAVTGNVTAVQSTGTNLHAVLDTTSTTAVTQATGTNLHAVLDTTSTTAVTQATGTNLHTVVDSGSITANAGTNLNTSALALDTSVLAPMVAEGTTAPSKLVVVGGETNDGTPQYDYLPLGTGGRTVIVEGFAGGTAIPVSLASAPSTAVTQGTSPWVVGQATGTNLHAVLDTTSTTAVTQATGTNLHAVLDTTSTTAVTQATASNLNATVVGSNTPADGFVTPTTAVPVQAFLQGLNLSSGNFDRLYTESNANDGEATVATGNLGVESHNMVFNGSTYDRARSAGIGNGVAATGLAATVPYCQNGTTLPTNPASGDYGSIQCDQYGRQIVVDQQVPALLTALNLLITAQNNQKLRGTFGVPLGSIGDALKVTPVQQDPCTGIKQSIAISQTASTRYVIGNGHRSFICSVLIVGADAENVSIVEGTGSTCGTATLAVIGGATAANGPNLAANGGFSMGNGAGTIAAIGVPGDDVCLFESGSGRVAGVMTVAFGQ